jgi:phosphohistidine phosphatase SixA
MTVLLVRHATAGHRTEGTDDQLRPLDDRGRRQAEGLVDALADYDIRHVLTSPAVRCRQTVEPLAGSLGLPVAERQELAEGSTVEDVLGLVSSLNGETAVLCTHGDVVGELLGEESKKGSTWVLDVGADGSLERRDHIAAPA